MFLHRNFWFALALVGLWVWSLVATTSPIGPALFATSVLLPIAGFLVISASRQELQPQEAEV
ncbi:MAG: hypothetical protein EA422_05100 [Gemmatimonadales bacterium]|nr:MAG: hypothetical protein EA422_05100 [Gemmatimonadales bacterium]